MPTVGLALIALNEEEALPALLASVAGAFDEVVLLDTGSTDGTVDVFTAWAADEQAAGRLARSEVGHFTWQEDFGAARQAAHAMLRTDWECWADCDDVIDGAGQLRRLAAEAAPAVAGYIFEYDYAQAENGACVCSLRRERLVRAGRGTWQGAVHEAQVLAGDAVVVPPDVAIWRHRKDHAARPPGDRNLRILRAWDEREPDTPRVIAYLGSELQVRGETAEATAMFERYLRLPAALWGDERAQVHRKLASCLIAAGDTERAYRVAADGAARYPRFADSLLSLAELALTEGAWDNALAHADAALRVGAPDTLLIINPLDYTAQPLTYRAQALACLGRYEEAVDAARQALALVPNDLLAGQLAIWQARLKADRTAATYVMAAEQHLQHDEQLKARALLECVPYFAADHPAVIEKRAEVRERLSFLDGGYDAHYVLGGSKPEDFLPDDEAYRTAARLPRAAYALRTLGGDDGG